MPTLFQQIQAGKVWDFHGGIHPPSRKERTNQKPVALLDIPDRLYIPLRQHIGVAGKVLVKVGDRVLKGQALTQAENAMAVPVHAPTSGTVLAIELHTSTHPSSLAEPTLILAPDGMDEWRPRKPLDPEQVDLYTLLERIQESGISGMGGAGFPTHIKVNVKQPVDYLIINAVECEPYITADDMLMQERASDIIAGIEILVKLLSPKAVLIGIEDDKPIAVASLKAAIGQKDNYFVREVPTKYPSGGEKQLIQLLTNKEVPAGRRPLDIGIVMQNVGTAFAIAQAVLDDIPLIHRVVTVAGETLAQQQNVLALIGTPISDLLNACGFQAEPQQRIIVGGPMMGFAIADWSVPVVKTTNCILAPTENELGAASDEMDCIRCGACADACPASLLPQQLLWYSKAHDQDKLAEYNLSDCIECGACAYVCPSEIPLVHYYRVAKAEIRETQREALKAEQAKARFDARTERLEREKQERLERNQQLAAQRVAQQQASGQTTQSAAAVQQALERTQQQSAQPLDKEQIIAERERKKAEALAYQQQKQQAQTATPAEDTTATTAEDPRKAAIAAALARAKAKKQAEAQPEAVGQPAPAETATADIPEADAKKAAVAAAIARAKAKKLAEAQPEAIEQPAPAETAAPEVDAKKAAVAAAIARAKAKKLADAQPEASEQPAPAETAAPEVDAKKAAVAAAIARAKAKKLAEAQPETSEQPAPVETAAPEVDAKKAAVAAAIARAKAKKLAEQTQMQQIASEPATEATVQAEAVPAEQDAKKAAIAAAIARAKAKKQQNSEPL
ncbi:electron transport complex subunit RsxC [Rheinheimera sp. 1928-s]|uniref:electron transport complex subunit RsxC n=1 Tax=Rheinheimera sp. 1928-s TaxID=3033803 RepID=UPI0026059BBC|nr:electron transport complex subunit RsxC [Rheinheimera sp. 1928-s]MDF3125721.1 electron transport complex subunit RsxC [Rheinheimera sp. 1928-s]